MAPRDFDLNDLGSLRGGVAGEPSAGSAGEVGAATEAGTQATDGRDSREELPREAGMPPVPEVPEGSDLGGDVPSGDDPDEGDGRRRKRGIWRFIAFFGLGCLGVNLIGGILATALLSIGLASCVASCSDNPIGDSREAAAFIASEEATSADLEVLDALDGTIESLLQNAATDAGAESVEELRARVAAGSWPADEGQALSPRVWVRIAELSEAWLEHQTSESWVVDDFAYPFPDNGPIPVPPKRDENDRCVTRLLCVAGPDEGLYVHVRYFRWAREAYFEADLDEARDQADERAQMLAQVGESGLLDGHDFLVSNGDIYVWESGDEDALRDPDTFLTCVNAFGEAFGTYTHVELLVKDAPVMVNHDALSWRYPNDWPLEEVPFDTARELLVRSGHVRTFDHASGDVLLEGYLSVEGEPIDIDELTGSLAPTKPSDYRHPWRPPDELSVFDDTMVAMAAEALDAPAERIVVASHLDLSDVIYDSMDVWLIAPRGVFPETPSAFCAAVNGLRDDFWTLVPADEERRSSLYVHVFVVDEEAILDPDGNPVTFADMRTVAQEWPANLDGWSFDLLLTTMPSQTRWEDEDEPHPYDVKPSDVGGSIARSRSWRYGD